MLEVAGSLLSLCICSYLHSVLISWFISFFWSLCVLILVFACEHFLVLN